MKNQLNETLKRSIEEPDEFWKEQASKLEWNAFPKDILTEENGHSVWFRDGKINLSEQALDIHVRNGSGDRVAMIYDSPVTGTVTKYTYRELLDKVARFAGVLKAQGVEKGDRVIIYMPMIPEAAIAMLGCVRIGAVHSVVFGGFAAHELAVRIDDCQPKVLITASGGIEVDKKIHYIPIVEEAIKQSVYPPHSVIVKQRLQFDTVLPGGWLDFESAVTDADPVDAIPVESVHPSYILYTSGTTGKPKGIVRDTGGYATALRFSMEYIYGVSPGEVFWAASDVGWVVGHSYIVYAPLITGCTTIIYEGKPVRTPDAGAFWRVVEEHGVHVMFTAPTAIRAMRREDPEGSLIRERQLKSLRTQFLAGERCDTPTLLWLRDQLGVPVIDHWWQTETGWPIVATCMGEDHPKERAGAAGKAVPGYAIEIVDESGKEVQVGTEGYVVIRQPLPPGNLLTIWNNPERFKAGYLERFPGYYFSGDGGVIDDDGYITITGRVDDVINVAGHRLSTAEMEEVVATHSGIVECAVVGITDQLKGQVPVALIVTTSGVGEEIEKEVNQLVRNTIGAIATLKKVYRVKRLPKTRSGKILRNVLRDVLNGREPRIPSTIEDITVVDELKEEL